ncbi:BREX-1 system adenine-specific DNA-methyltransferase PglX, partial [Mycolicibacterium mageritense]|uniref:BREX-1 system adenine-specific DNA-methyltransferase PglX n=1 Tax=Mycolicibacterium mageritense TaxID=53462 RepID=UPI0011D9FE5A
METAPLKSFATWARTSLIREVTARIAVVLAPASPERVEQPKAVAALEKAVNAAGGGDKGRSAVADRVAYTWFNRIIALRFMDANGYTGIGVVSPQVGVGVGQPEILAEAKRGNLDPEVVSQKTRETITGLLNGTRRSDDPQGEAYALLLTEYCRHWNRAMPFMFERGGDFTELLIPANLLADDSVLNRAVRVLTADVCQDVEVIGWLYQFYISERKDEIFAAFKKNKRAGADEIPAATQLFTPHWIVRYLVENSLGRLWMLNRPTSRLAEKMDYYIAPVDEQTDFLKINSPEELKVIDPACGSGHMLTYAFDLLYLIYEEEGYAPSEIPGLILDNNLYGTEIDPRAGSLAAFALAMKARGKQRTFFNKQVEPNVFALEPISFTLLELDVLLTSGGDRQEETEFWNQFARSDLFGSLIQPRSGLASALAAYIDDHPAVDGDLIAADVHERARRVLRYTELLGSRYTVIVANPPYMGSGSMAAALAEFAASEYRRSKTDLFAMFIERCLSLGVQGAFVGMITMQSWLFISTYEALRTSILESRRVASLLQLGRAAFDTIGGAVVSTAAFVIEKAAGNGRRAVFIDLTSGRDEQAKSRALLDAVHEASAPHRRELAAARFLELPGAPFAHTIQNFDVFHGSRISDSWRSGGRLKTHDGGRFIRHWWEVSRGNVRWRPLIKGGDFRPFYGNRDFVVDWSGSALDFYRSHGGLYPEENRGVAGVCWTKIGRLSFRLKNEDEEFDSASPTLLPNDGDDVLPMLAYLNSSEVRALVAVLNPTINTQVANVLELPAPNWTVQEKEALSRLGHDLVAQAELEWNDRETSDGFVRPSWFSSTDSGPLSKALDQHLSACSEREAMQLKLADEIDAIVGLRLETGLGGADSLELVSERPTGPE